MTKDQIISLVITGVILLIMVSLSVVLLTGRGAFLIAGLNTMSKEEQKGYKKEKLCKFIGLVLLLIALCTAGIIIGVTFGVTFLWVAGIGLFAALIIFTLIFSNSKVFKNSDMN